MKYTTDKRTVLRCLQESSVEPSILAASLTAYAGLPSCVRSVPLRLQVVCSASKSGAQKRKRRTSVGANRSCQEIRNSSQYHTQHKTAFLLTPVARRISAQRHQSIQWHQRQQQRAVSGLQETLRTLATDCAAQSQMA